MIRREVNKVAADKIIKEKQFFIHRRRLVLICYQNPVSTESEQVFWIKTYFEGS
jgi:hypothetical protein